MRLPATILTLCLLSLTACSSTRSQSAGPVPWTGEKVDLGRLAIVHRLDDIRPEKTAERKGKLVRELTGSAFGELPGTSVVETPETLAGYQSGIMSEYEAVLAAREADIDTIALVTVHDLAGTLTVGFLPLPGFATDATADYSVRVLDARTGRLIADTRRTRSKGGYLHVIRRQEIGEQLERDLNVLLHE